MSKLNLWVQWSNTLAFMVATYLRCMKWPYIALELLFASGLLIRQFKYPHILCKEIHICIHTHTHIYIYIYDIHLPVLPLKIAPSRSTIYNLDCVISIFLIVLSIIDAFGYICRNNPWYSLGLPRRLTLWEVAKMGWDFCFDYDISTYAIH